MLKEKMFQELAVDGSAAASTAAHWAQGQGPKVLARSAAICGLRGPRPYMGPQGAPGDTWLTLVRVGGRDGTSWELRLGNRQRRDSLGEVKY